MPLQSRDLPFSARTSFVKKLYRIASIIDRLWESAVSSPWPVGS